MRLRSAALAGTWYPAEPDACRAFLDSLALSPPLLPPDLVAYGGIAPHAGWVYSGPTAALTFAGIGRPSPRAFLLYGVPHRVRLHRPALSRAEAWETPLGPAPVDPEIAGILRDAGIEEDDRPHPAGENSLEVLLPILRHFHPESAVLPVAMPARPVAAEVGAAVGVALAKLPDRVVAIGSTDLTHYGDRSYGFAPRGTGEAAHRWAKETNDRAFLDRLVALDAAGALEVAGSRRSACGGGAAAAAVATARALGATEGRVLLHTTSHEAGPGEGPPRDFVGYASALFCGPG